MNDVYVVSSKPRSTPAISVSQPPIAPREPEATVRSLLIRALQSWILAQHLPQRIIAERLKIPRSTVSELSCGKSHLAAERLLDLWSALGGQWDFTLTHGASRRTIGSLSTAEAHQDPLPHDP
jgi:predicted XRE-type DNA-binding protein